MKVLIVKLSALGDVVQALPCAMAIKDQHPEAQIHWLVESPSASLLKDHPAIDKVLVSPRYLIRNKKNESFRIIKSFMQELRKQRYDFVLDLQGLMKSAIFVALAKAEKKTGFAGGKEPLAAYALNHRLLAYDPDRPALKRYLDALEGCGFSKPCKVEFGLRPTSCELDQVREMTGSGQDGFVVLHPVAKWETKLWPERHWAKLARGLAEQGLNLVLTGSKADQQVTARIAAQANLGKKLQNLAGCTDLKQLAALLSLAKIMVTTDTGAMHLAAALETKTVALFGPTAPWRTGPFGNGHAIMRLELECSPCFKKVCSDPRCLSYLGPKSVTQAALKLLEKTKAEPTPPVE